MHTHVVQAVSGFSFHLMRITLVVNGNTIGCHGGRVVGGQNNIYRSLWFYLLAIKFDEGWTPQHC